MEGKGTLNEAQGNLGFFPGPVHVSGFSEIRRCGYRWAIAGRPPARVLLRHLLDRIRGR